MKTLSSRSQSSLTACRSFADASSLVPRKAHATGAARLSAVAVAALATLLTLPGTTHAQQKFPLKPVRVVVAFSAGGTNDILARLITQGMGEAWGQPIVIEPRPGAGGTLAAAIVSKAAPDGYTLLATSASFPISAASGTKLPYDPLKDFATVGEIGDGTQVLVVSPSLGVKTVKEFIAHANTRPSRLLFGSTGALTSTHLSTERFRSAVGIRATHVAFKGQSEYVIEIVADRVRILGKVFGPIRASAVELGRTARVVGDIRYETLTVEPEAHVDGHLQRVDAATAVAADREPGSLALVHDVAKK